MSLYSKNLGKYVYNAEKENEPNFNTKIVEFDDTKIYGYINDIHLFLSNQFQSNKIVKDFNLLNLNRSKFLNAKKVAKD
jgi:hypothetical protein